LRKLIGLAVLLVALAIPTAAFAATLSNGNGQTCSGSGTWLFVNNQTGGAGPGMLTASFSGGVTLTTGPAKVLANTQHFYVSTAAGATLLNATTNLPGRLQLSDFTCDGGKKGEDKK
jgi:hypothetical protein